VELRRIELLSRQSSKKLSTCLDLIHNFRFGISIRSTSPFPILCYFRMTARLLATPNPRFLKAVRCVSGFKRTASKLLITITKQLGRSLTRHLYFDHHFLYGVSNPAPACLLIRLLSCRYRSTPDRALF
jgi:hypothetical protein